MTGCITTTCQVCGQPAEARKLLTGAAVFLHADGHRPGHAVVPLPEDELERAAFGGEPYCQDVKLGKDAPL